MARNIFPVLFLLCTLAIAQTEKPATEADPAGNRIFRVDVNLVQVDAVVTDKDDRPVMDLTVEDFTILQDGKHQDIVNFSLVRLPPPIVPGPDAQEPSREESPQAPQAPVRLTSKQVRRVVALVVDDLGLDWNNTVLCRDAIKKWIDEEMQPGDLVAVITTGYGMGGLQQFTGEKQQLYSAIDRIRFNILSRIDSTSYDAGTTALSDLQKEERNRGTAMGTLESLRFIINSMEMLPGRKSLILFSSSLTMNPDSYDPDDANAVFEMNLSDSIKEGMVPLVQEANRADVVVHTIDPRGNTWGLDMDASAGDILTSREGLTTLSQQTGGLALHHHNFPEVALQKAARDGEVYYLLGYRPDAEIIAEMEAGRSKYHRLEVRVKRRGLQVRSRSGFFSTTEDPEYAPAPDADTLAQAMLSPLRNDDLTVRLASGYVYDLAWKYLLRTWVHLPGRQLTVLRDKNGNAYISLETYAATTGIDGRVRDSDRTEHNIPLSNQDILSIREHGLRFSVTIPAKDPGTFFIRLAVKDKGSGKIGTAYQYMEIPDLRKGTPALSDLFAVSGNEDVQWIIAGTDGESAESSYSTGQDRGKNPAIRQYQPGEDFEYLALMYNADTRMRVTPDLETRTVLYRDGSEIFRSNPETVDLSGVSDYGSIPIKKRMRLGKTMQPGYYMLQLQVWDKLEEEKKILAARALDFEVIPEREHSTLEKAEEWIRKGNEANRAGKKEEAVQAFKETFRLYREELRLYPKDTVLWKQAGTVSFMAGDTDQAAASYEEAVRIDPHDAESHYMLGIIRAATDVNPAIDDFREAIRLNPENARYHFDLGRAQAQMKEYDAALESFREASSLDPEDGESHASMGIVLQQMGEMDGAVAEYRQALSLNLTDDSAESVRQLLKKALSEVEDPDAEKLREYLTLKVKEWRSAAEQHTPEKPDAAAVEIGSWPVNDLDIIISLVGNIREGKLDSIVESSLVRAFKGREYIEENILPLLQAPEDESQLLRSAAILHTDIAMLQLDTGHLDAKTVMYRGIVYRKGTDAAISVQDGRGTGQSKGWHWEFARQLLARLTPDPSNKEMLQKWYVATTAFMLSNRHFGHAEDNLVPALEFFPSDPRLLFYSGVLHENYAAPAFQNALRPEGLNFGFSSEALELKQAMDYFKKALEADPEFSEARLHLGRVTGLLGNHEEAVQELQRAADSVTDSRLRYYCSLYLGNELAALNRGKEARRQFETAARLYPRAQAPLLSLSQIALNSGDHENAQAFGSQIFTLPAKEDTSEDPWWNYSVSPVLDAGGLISEMYDASGKIFPETTEP